MPLFTFEELPKFTERALELLTDEDLGMLQLALLRNPELGKVIKGGGGLRKARVALPGRGKSGGARVIYLYYRSESRITLCALYAKNEKETLSASDVKALLRQTSS